MGIPKNAPNPEGAKALIQHLDEARPTGGAPLADGLLPGRRRSALEADLARVCSPRPDAVRKQQQAKDAVQALLPIGIGAEGGNFSKYYRDTFTRIVRNGEDIQKVLKEQGELLDQIFVKTNAPCWAPDPSSGKGRCVVK